MKNKKNIEKKNIIQKIVNFIFKIYSIKSRKKENKKENYLDYINNNHICYISIITKKKI